MLKNMSSKSDILKYFFLLLFLLFNITIFAEINNFVQLELKSFKYNSEKSRRRISFNYQIQIQKKPYWAGFFETDFLSAEDGFEDSPNQTLLPYKRYSYLNNFFRGRITYQKNDASLKLEYRNKFYNPNKTEYYLTFVPSPGEDFLPYKIKPNLLQNVIVSLQQDIPNFSLETNGRFRNHQYEIDRSEIPIPEYSDTVNVYENDLFWDAKIRVKIFPFLTLFSKNYYKQKIDNFESYVPPDAKVSVDYDHFRGGVGLEFSKKILTNNFLQSSFEYQYNDGMNISSQEDFFYDYFNTYLRYSTLIGTDIAGFVSYINRSCYNRDDKQFYLISDALRCHLKYTFQTDKSCNSFILTGFKYNPIHFGNAIFGEINYQIFSELYINFGDSYSPDITNDVKIGLEYFLTSFNRIYLSGIHSKILDENSANDEYSLITFGMKFVF